MTNKVVVLNSGLVDFDHKIDYSTIASDIEIYEETAEDQILDRVQDAVILVTKEMPVPAKIAEQFPDSVKMIIEAGTGYNNLPLDTLKEKGILVTNIPEYSTQRVAHTAILLMLSLASSMQQQLRMIANGNHDNFSKHLMVDHVELNGKTLGVIGFGHIAKKIITIAQALDMNILVSTRTPREDFDGIHFTSKEEVYQNSDFLSLNLPLTDATKHMINKETLAMMKPNAYLINTARGGLVNEVELIDALNHHVIAGAGLDVQENEPLADASPLFEMDNVIVTPHMGWRGLETRQRLVSLIKKNVDAFNEGAPINLV